eukprot:CAMPEP_0185832442 /NCGR_PEP_ID=MMETSP1353-20130828/2085_1 /TAXON_ID=1077150 /ORGANISM="Erythrolobus australicus, Strain CCMP3124" /LENGTH=73 /DNA_ID=CAMNT_0028530615 /DNA_START=236 /DNA_END=457 /DNA_ORIENTATION=+
MPSVDYLRQRSAALEEEKTRLLALPRASQYVIHRLRVIERAQTVICALQNSSATASDAVSELETLMASLGLRS